MKQVKHSKKAIFLLIAVCIVIFSLSCVSAADVYVSTNGSDSNNGSVNSPYLTIGTGVSSAAANDTVHIADGVYSGTGNNYIDIHKNLTISGQSQSGTIIDGNNANRIFSIAPGFNVVLQDLTITNANTTNFGGAIYNDHGTLTATNCSFTNNNAGGGAIYNDHGTLTATNCNFTNNNAGGGGGGGAIMNNEGTATLTGCNFTNNNAGGGGAINNYGTATLTGCTFTGNNAGFYGGAILTQGTATLTGCTFTGNNAGFYGGAFYNIKGNTTVTGCTFTGNNADYGGAIITFDTATVTGCTFTGNNAESGSGGAIYNGGTLSVNFSRIIGNNALLNGNAIYNKEGTVNATYNWWGTNTPDFANLIFVENGSVNAIPWLVLSINATPGEICNTQTSNVTVDLYTDSNGANHSSESAKYPAVIPVTLTTTWGSIIPTAITLNHGAGAALFTADGGAIPTNPFVATVSAADSANKTATVPANITIKPASNLYVTITSSNSNPKVGETFTLTYKLGNKGPDAAGNVTITIPVPENFGISSISGDGSWTYDSATRTITWTSANVPVGDPYLYITGKTTKAGTYSFGSSIASDTYNLNSEGVTPLTISAATEVNAASNTVAMQNTGVPVNYLILAILAVISGFVVPRRK